MPSLGLYRSKSGASGASSVSWCHLPPLPRPFPLTVSHSPQHRKMPRLQQEETTPAQEPQETSLADEVSQSSTVIKVATGSSRGDQERSKPVCDQKSPSVTAVPSCRAQGWQVSHHFCSAEGEMPGQKAFVSSARQQARVKIKMVIAPASVGQSCYVLQPPTLLQHPLLWGSSVSSIC